MVGKSLDNLRITHEEVINALTLQIAALNTEVTVMKLENQKLKNFVSEYVNGSLVNNNTLSQE
jgi:hypothetical protein